MYTKNRCVTLLLYVLYEWEKTNARKMLKGRDHSYYYTYRVWLEIVSPWLFSVQDSQDAPLRHSKNDPERSLID